MASPTRDGDESGERDSPAGGRLEDLPNVVLADYPRIYEETYRNGALPTRTKEIVALAISIARNCEPCYRYHLSRLADAGAVDDILTEEEFADLVALVLVTVGSLALPPARNALEIFRRLATVD